LAHELRYYELKHKYFLPPATPALTAIEGLLKFGDDVQLERAVNTQVVRYALDSTF